ncbi:MAG: hypothetical protein WD016_07780 [Balneolaceae bacterium]
MDPSEELEFEQLMLEDENLLIEVESLRATEKKVAKIPIKNPPESITRKIAYEAKQLQSDRIKKSRKLYIYLRRGIAAAVLLCAFSGGYYYFSDFSEPEEISPVSSEQISPWVDRNEVLRYSGATQASTASSFDTEVIKSYEKLQLVKFSSGDGTVLGIHLTGSPQ